MSRPQFTLRALLILILAVACFFGGIATERHVAKRKASSFAPVDIVVGVHGVDLEGVLADLAKKAKTASEEPHNRD